MDDRISVGDVKLSFTDTGGDGPAVLLLHGLGGYADEWSGTIRGLQPEYRVVAFDQRGHGGSSRRPDEVSRGAYVNEVVDVAQALGLNRVTLVGQSMGGHTAR